MTPPPTFDRVYSEIRRRILAGRWLPGQRIDLPRLASDIGVSVTPVRDAVHRLVGESLLATGPKEGFAVPGLTEPDLRDMYEWLHQLLMLAMRRLSTTPGRSSDEIMEQQTTSCAALFAVIANRCDNIEIRAAILSVEARLAQVHRVENELLADEEVFADLYRAWADEDHAALRTRLTSWHRRHIQASGRIVQFLHRPDRRTLTETSG